MAPADGSTSHHRHHFSHRAEVEQTHVRTPQTYNAHPHRHVLRVHRAAPPMLMPPTWLPPPAPMQPTDAADGEPSGGHHSTTITHWQLARSSRGYSRGRCMLYSTPPPLTLALTLAPTLP